MRRRRSALALAFLAIGSAGPAWAEQPGRGAARGFSGGAAPAGRPPGGDVDVVVATASEWGGSQGVYTCDEWRRYLKRMFNLADKRHRGFIDAQDFEVVRRVSPVFRAASFDYFDMAGAGRVSQKDFLAFPSPFFARFDKTKACRVTQEELRQAAKAPAAGAPGEAPEGRPRGGGMPGRGGGGFGRGGGGFGGM